MGLNFLPTSASSYPTALTRSGTSRDLTDYIKIFGPRFGLQAFAHDDHCVRINVYGLEVGEALQENIFCALHSVKFKFQPRP